jgi:hypothetical protein
MRTCRAMHHSQTECIIELHRAAVVLASDVHSAWPVVVAANAAEVTAASPEVRSSSMQRTTHEVVCSTCTVAHSTCWPDAVVISTNCRQSRSGETCTPWICPGCRLPSPPAEHRRLLVRDGHATCLGITMTNICASQPAPVHDSLARRWHAACVGQRSGACWQAGEQGASEVMYACHEV